MKLESGKTYKISKKLKSAFSTQSDEAKVLSISAGIVMLEVDAKSFPLRENIALNNLENIVKLSPQFIQETKTNSKTEQDISDDSNNNGDDANSISDIGKVVEPKAAKVDIDNVPEGDSNPERKSVVEEKPRKEIISDEDIKNEESVDTKPDDGGSGKVPKPSMVPDKDEESALETVVDTEPEKDAEPETVEPKSINIEPKPEPEIIEEKPEDIKKEPQDNNEPQSDPFGEDNWDDYNPDEDFF